LVQLSACQAIVSAEPGPAAPAGWTDDRFCFTIDRVQCSAPPAGPTICTFCGRAQEAPPWRLRTGTRPGSFQPTHKPAEVTRRPIVQRIAATSHVTRRLRQSHTTPRRSASLSPPNHRTAAAPNGGSPCYDRLFWPRARRSGPASAVGHRSRRLMPCSPLVPVARQCVALGVEPNLADLLSFGPTIRCSRCNIRSKPCRLARNPAIEIALEQTVLLQHGTCTISCLDPRSAAEGE